MPGLQNQGSSHLSSHNNQKKRIYSLILAFFLIIFLVLAIFLYRASNQRSNTNATPDARSAYFAGDLKKAKEKYKKAYEANKKDPKAIADVIKTIAFEGNQTGQEKKSLQDARPYIDSALKIDDKNIDILLSVGYAYETAGNYQEALKYYSEAVKLYPDVSYAWFHHGHVLEFLGKRNDADKSYDESLKINPENTSTLMAKANIAGGKGDLENSYGLYKKAASVEGISSILKAEALTGASIVRRNQVLHMREAISLAREAVNASPTFSPALSAYGYALAINGNPNQGIIYLKKSIDTNPRISKNYSQLAQVYRANKDFTNSINTQKIAISKVDDDNTILGTEVKKVVKARYIYDLAKTYDKAKIEANIISLLSEAVRVNPAIRQVIKADFEKSLYFESLANDSAFEALVK